MRYFRFRPRGELYIKELLYSELYFASVEESNDPYDSKVFLSYDFDQPKWQRLLEAAWRGLGDKELLSPITKPLSEQIASDRPCTFEDVMSYSFIEKLKRIDKQIDDIVAIRLSETLKYYIDLYRNPDSYFVAFSRKNNDTLMWSHYASRHYGYCLIFKAIENSLAMDMTLSGKGIRRDTPRGIGPSTSSPLPTKFLFENIQYCKDIEPIDASRFMPAYISGNVTFSSESERLKYIDENQRKCLEKHSCWEYENESRLVLREPFPWLFGQHNPLTKQERLFHYDFSQLVGIIIGAKMDKDESERIIEIIRAKRESLWPQSTTVKRIFDFVVFNASISDKSRDVIISPRLIMTGASEVTKNDKSFTTLLSDWERGKALVIDGNRSTTQIFD